MKCTSDRARNLQRSVFVYADFYIILFSDKIYAVILKSLPTCFYTKEFIVIAGSILADMKSD